MASTARLDELKKKFDENPRRYFAPLANEHRKSGDLDQAIALCRTHLPQQPAHISGHIVLAQALYEAGSLDESREIFHTALGLDPENLIALRYLGDIARDSADIETARSWYHRVLEVDPRNEEIVQLVRDLDAPPREPEPVVTPEAAAPLEQTAASAVEPIAAPPVAPESVQAPAEDRFAPLSLDQLDMDVPESSVETAPQSNADVPDAAPTHEMNLDVGAEWGTDSAATEPLLDTPGIDPFEMPEHASADALFDAASQEQPTDYFLEAFKDTPDAAEVAGEPEVIESLDWTPTPEPEAPVPAPAAELDVAEFEAGDFYVEPAPAAPVSEEASADADTSMGWSLASETPDAPRPVLEGVRQSPAPEPEPVAELPQEPEIEEIADIAMFAEAPTAEWNAAEVQRVEAPVEPPPAIPSTELGLETMEFVPPSSPTPASVPAVVSPNAEHTGTPAAFVTETMAELYLQQGFRNEALAVYRELLARNPSDDSLRERIEKIESGSMSSIGMAMVSENVVESALRRQTAKPTKSVRSFFAALASRRAPAPREVPVSELAPEPVDEPIAEPGAPEAAAPTIESPDSSRLTPMMSAAETLASYDPFAEEAVAETEIDIPAPELLPNEPQAAADAPSFPTPSEPAAFVETPAPNAAEPPAPPVASQPEMPAGKTLEDLFPDAPVAPRAEAAAQTFATAFGRQEPQGRPTRAASSELSLDKVFRGSNEGTPPADGGFSFDQFFSDSRTSGSDVAAAPAVSPPETGRSSGGAGDAHDIEQFTAWLEGLKKK